MATARKPVELGVALAHSPGVNLHLRIHPLADSMLVFLASSAVDAGLSTPSMGSLVYAMPDRFRPSQPISTALYSLPSSVDFSTRVAKALARRLARPCYVASSVNLSASAGGGGSDEEMEAFRAVIAAVLDAA